MSIEYKNEVVHISDFDDPLYVDFDYSRGQKSVHTLRNGDPGQPDEPSEVTVNAVRFIREIGDDASSILTKAAHKEIEEECYHLAVNKEEYLEERAWELREEAREARLENH